jgi:hypothetical protein
LNYYDMKRNHYPWALPLTGAVLFGTAVAAEQDKATYLNSTNRVTLSLRFGLNIKSKFSGLGNSFTTGSMYGNGRRTPNGDPYNYDDGYVLTDSTGNALNLTTYWGYDTDGQWSGSVAPGADTITFQQTAATANPGNAAGSDDRTFPGFELAYDRELGKKADWHDLRYGVEAALNYLNLSLSSASGFGATVATATDVYQLPGTTPPGAPFQGTYDGSPGGYALLGVPVFSHTPGGPITATVLSQDHFDADLWGGRLGPYVELPLNNGKWDVRLSGGLAVGLLNGNESWTQTLTPAVGSPVTYSGGGSAFDALWGFYVSLEAAWQLNQRWAVDAAVQYQDLGKFNHNFQGRQVELDLSRSLFLELGVSYCF